MFCVSFKGVSWHLVKHSLRFTEFNSSVISFGFQVRVNQILDNVLNQNIIKNYSVQSLASLVQIANHYPKFIKVSTTKYHCTKP